MNPGSKQHYDSHLAAVYSWMAGGADAAIERNRKFLEAHVGRAKAPVEPSERGLPGRSAFADSNAVESTQPRSADSDVPSNSSTRSDGFEAPQQEPSPCLPLAVDLGCGSGFQSIPLAEFGYRVLAVDNCPSLLAELSSHCRSLPIQPTEADLIKFRSRLSEPAELIVCLGDTLTHLPSLEAVATLIRDIAAALAPDGRCLLGFRDYVSRELVGEQRFIPVRSDDTRILTCFLEYHPDQVLVHDLLHERTAAGWTQRVSSYRKLRLDPAWVAERLRYTGLSIENQTVEAGMVCLLAAKPASS